MATVDNLMDKASGAAQSAARAAKYVALISKKRLAILNEQEKIRRSYTKLGKVYYKDYVTDEEPDDAEYCPLCESISESFRRINELREEIAAAKAAYNAEKTEEPRETEEYDILPMEAFSAEAPEENATPSGE